MVLVVLVSRYLSVGLPESNAVRGSIRPPRRSLRGRPGVLYDGPLAPVVSSVKRLMNGWMDGCIWVVYILVYFKKVVDLVWGGGSLLYDLRTHSIQFETVWQCSE